MNRPPRALQVVDTLGMGGAETWLMEVLRLWARTGAARMDFLVTSGQRGLFDEEAEALGAKIHYVRYGRANLPAFAWAFRRVLREGRYDAIHDHQDYSAGWHFLLGAGRLPAVRAAHVHNPAYQIRNNYGVNFGRRLTARIGKALLAKYATHIVGTSRQVIGEYGFDAPMFARIPKGPLHCGFEPARFLADRSAARAAVTAEFGWPDEALVALFAGRIDVSPDPDHPQAHKNAGFAVDVAIAAAQREPRLRLLLAGKESPAVPLLQARIAEAGLENRIVFAGVRRDIERLMAAADVLLFPSRGEGLGMVAVEAQAAGLPVLASSAVPAECAVVPDLVRFVDLAAEPETWAEALLALAAVPRRTAEANRQVAASAFAVENSAKAMADLYRSGRLG
jgi:glycosyltransferase involved in cell wall biosynthesis